MAGIGFELRKLANTWSLFSPVMALGHSAVIAAGPWLMTILALGALDALSTSLMSKESLVNFRTIVIYAFLLSLVAATPVITLAVRLLSDALYARRVHCVRRLYIATLVVSGLASAALSAIIEGAVFSLKGPLLVSAIQTCTLIGLLWVSLAFCSAVRDFNTVTLSFAVGLSLAVFATIAVAGFGGSVSSFVGGFNIGLGFVFLGLTRRVLLTFPQPMESLGAALRDLWDGLRSFSILFFGALAGVIAVWIDKWIMWLGPSGEQTVGGLLNSPGYDGAMFIAYLSLVPALGLFISKLEPTFFALYRQYFASINNHATLDQIKNHERNINRVTNLVIYELFLCQICFSVIIILCTPMVRQNLDFSMDKLELLDLVLLAQHSSFSL